MLTFLEVCPYVEEVLQQKIKHMSLAPQLTRQVFLEELLEATQHTEKFNRRVGGSPHEVRHSTICWPGSIVEKFTGRTEPTFPNAVLFMLAIQDVNPWSPEQVKLIDNGFPSMVAWYNEQHQPLNEVPDPLLLEGVLRLSRTGNLDHKGG